MIAGIFLLFICFILIKFYSDKRQSNPNISEWMIKHNFTEYNQLQAYYSNKVLDISQNLKKNNIVWQGK